MVARAQGDKIRREGGFGSQSCKSFLHALLRLMLEAVAVWANWLKRLSAKSYEKKMSGGIWLLRLHIQECGKWQKYESRTENFKKNNYRGGIICCEIKHQRRSSTFWDIRISLYMYGKYISFFPTDRLIPLSYLCAKYDTWTRSRGISSA